MTVRPLTPSVCSYGALRRATRGISDQYDQALAPAGINAAQFNLLRAIERLGAATQSELAHEVVMDLSALGHTLKPLIRDGWITLEKDAADSRRRLIAMTPDGSHRLRAALRLWKPVQKRFEAYLGQPETKTLLALLDHLASGGFGEA
ncbi:MarR family winged helix-turn-helix transcriptional regulator [Burkholderia perseverans]|uniref:MarR family winged helix-turn-helix transcriptional regulator n=1 Tax=Burkholderia perseverans TaxID=2615214 RepID=UPI001FEE6B30|nr:MarR family winged helix-turn-helix transcriptional regulator [Burkholderia perseverans]